jgi:hypothetical protein
MSTLDTADTMREELALQEAIKRQADEVVKLANEAIAGLPQGTKLEKNQFSNLLNVAQSSESVEVIVNYLRYQMGREQKLWGTKENDLAHVIIRHIRASLHALAHQQIAAFLKERDLSTSPETLQEAHFRLVHQYIGYLRRAFVYGKAGSFAALEEVNTNA